MSEWSDAEIGTKKRNDFVRRWKDLCERRAKLDYELATLCREIRDEFPNGSSGDYQFRRWSVANLGIAGSTASMLLRASTAQKRFNQDLWDTLGGWQSIGFLNSLDSTGRKKVLKACRERLSISRYPTISYTTVRSLAFAQGVAPKPGMGRPNKMRSETDLGFLRAWLSTLYDQYNLPSMPKHVRDAMKASKLEEIKEALRQTG